MPEEIEMKVPESGHEETKPKPDRSEPKAQAHTLPTPPTTDLLRTSIEPAEDDGGEAILSGRSREGRDEVHQDTPDESDLGPTSVSAL